MKYNYIIKKITSDKSLSGDVTFELTLENVKSQFTLKGGEQVFTPNIVIPNIETRNPSGISTKASILYSKDSINPTFNINIKQSDATSESYRYQIIDLDPGNWAIDIKHNMKIVRIGGIPANTVTLHIIYKNCEVDPNSFTDKGESTFEESFTIRPLGRNFGFVLGNDNDIPESGEGNLDDTKGPKFEYDIYDSDVYNVQLKWLGVSKFVVNNIGYINSNENTEYTTIKIKKDDDINWYAEPKSRYILDTPTGARKCDNDNIILDPNAKLIKEIFTLTVNWDYGIESITFTGSTIEGESPKTITIPGSTIDCNINDIITIEEIKYEEGYTESIEGILNSHIYMYDNVVFEYNPMSIQTDKYKLTVNWETGIDSVEFTGDINGTIHNSGESLMCNYGDTAYMNVYYKENYSPAIVYPSATITVYEDTTIIINGLLDEE